METTKKLTLEHLAPYLPYKLRIVNTKAFEAYKGNILTLSALICNNSLCVSELGANQVISHHKPILRPLSDLTKEIDIDGWFVPIKHILHDYRDSLELKMNFYDGVLVEFWLDYPNNDGDYVQESTVVLTDWFKLFEWHFDVFGLIDQDLAIDINTLPNVKG